MAFDIDQLIEDCAAALAESESEAAVRQVVARAVSNPPDCVNALGEPRRAEIQRLHASESLTVLNVVWGPEMTLLPHNHNMWAVIGVYGGREDNIFWRRCPADAREGIEAAGAKSLGPGEAQPLGPGIIHSVTNPTSKLTGAIHVYGGDFFAKARSEWDPETLLERPYDIEQNLKRFEAANAALVG